MSDLRAALVAIQELHQERRIPDVYAMTDWRPVQWIKFCTSCDQPDYPCPTRRLADEALSRDSEGA